MPEIPVSHHVYMHVTAFWEIPNLKMTHADHVKAYAAHYPYHHFLPGGERGGGGGALLTKDGTDRCL